MDTDAPAFDVTIARRVSSPTWWAPLSRAAEKIVSSLPTHRDTQSGRRNARQVRLAMLATGVLVVVLWRSPWAPLALVLCLASLVVPLSESARRQWIARLRSGRVREVVKRTPGELVVEPRHVVLREADDVVRKLRRSAIKLTREPDTLQLTAGGKKKERLVISTATGGDEDLWAERGELEPIEAALR